MKKRVLLLAPPYMDIYKDIIQCLDSKGYEVVWVSDGSIPGNPYNKSEKSRHLKTVEEYQSEVDVFWDENFEKENFLEPFDYFLAIDGFMVTPHMFAILKDKNPNIRKVLYLYDRVEGNYEVDMFFPYYTNIYSFDLGDCAHYGINHLPIYWVPSETKVEEEYDIFGLGGFQWGARYEVFKKLKEISEQSGFKDYIKLYNKSIDNKLSYFFKYLVYKLNGRKMLSLSELKGDLYTTKSLTPQEFRDMILRSRVVLDTQNSNQDGMTARFMWALGAEKKIITTNKAVKKNVFFSPEQILVLKSNFEDIPAFISKKFTMSDDMRSLVKRYRIDNWIDTMLLADKANENSSN